MADNLDKLIDKMKVYAYDSSVHTMDTNDMRNAIKALALIAEALVGEVKTLRDARYESICKKLIKWTCSDKSIIKLDVSATNLIYSQILNGERSGEFMAGEFGKGTWEVLCNI